MNEKHRISVFLPVYNGAKYLEETIETILQQTYSNFKLYCVDDSSSDESYTILMGFAAIDQRIKVFKKENGGTVPKSWNFILDHLIGDFIFYLSQDDLLSSDLFERMMLRYIETDADIIVPDLEFYHEGRINNKCRIGLAGNHDTILDGKSAFCKSLNWEVHGFALRRRSLYLNEKFPEDSFDSDEFVNRKLFAKSTSIAFSTGTFFYRQDNANAITKTATVKNFYTLNTEVKLLNLLISENAENTFINGQKLKIIKTHFINYTLISNFKFSSISELREITRMQKSLRKLIISKMFYENSSLKLRLFCVVYKVKPLLILVRMLHNYRYKRLLQKSAKMSIN